MGQKTIQCTPTKAQESLLAYVPNYVMVLQQTPIESISLFWRFKLKEAEELRAYICRVLKYSCPPEHNITREEL